MPEIPNIDFEVNPAEVITVPIDATLSVAGEAADAKATGDALALKANISQLSSAVTVNGQAAGTNSDILVTAESIPMDSTLASFVSGEIAALQARTGADIPINAETGADSIKDAVAAAISDAIGDLAPIASSGEPADLASVVPISKGGTNASNVSGALANLGLSDVNSKITALEGTVYGTTSTAEDDLNDITTNGTYWLNFSNYSHGPTDNGYGVLEVYGNRTGSLTLQRVTLFSSSATARPRVYQRIYTNSQWYAWVGHNGELMTKTASGTTSSAGSLAASLAWTRYVILSAYAPGYICIPYRAASASSLYIKVLDTSLQPVASESVAVTITYLDMGEGAFS